MGTSRDHRNLMKTGLGVLLLVALLQTETEAQMCSVAPFVRIDENLPAGTVVATVTVEDASVSLQLVDTAVPFKVEGNRLLTTKVLDYDTGDQSYSLKISCSKPGETSTSTQCSVVVENLNDNIPTFQKDVYLVEINEMIPKGSAVGTFNAIDPDNLGPLVYTLSSQDYFKLKPDTAEIVVAKVLLYDDVKTVELVLTVQDADPTHTDSTNITITIKDVDNRPPWFQPCTVVENQGGKICPNSGYWGKVNLGQLVTGPLDLIPTQILAIDGDNGINEAIQYSISGDEGLFTIEPNTGDITQVKAINEVKTVNMTVMAFQAVNTFQFATTTLTIDVLIKSLHKPQFQKAQYEAVVEGAGSMAVEAADKTQALKLVVTDEDYADAGGINPNIDFSITNNAAFSVFNGFLFMTTDVAAGNYALEVKAIDTIDFEQATAQIAVEVLEEPTTTTSPPTTTTSPPTTTTSPTVEPTTGKTTAPTSGSTAITTNQTPDKTTKPDSTTAGTSLSTLDTATPSSNPTTPDPTGGSVQTSNPTSTTGGTTGGEINPPGGFTSVDMAALGATLGVLLFICVVVIAVLIVKVRKGDSDWKKINEASAFRSSLGPSGQKAGVQFTNDAFQHDDDDKDNKGGPSGGDLKKVTDKPQTRSIPRPPSPIQDDEKEVKPILSKDKSKEDGYKAVWFKEDIDPNAKEEVVIIPDSRAEEDEEDSDGEMKTPKVKFNDTDRDSGLGEKMDDSDEDRVMMSSL